MREPTEMVPNPNQPIRNADSRLVEIYQKYNWHPEFLGSEMFDVNQKGAMDDSLIHIASRTGAVADVRELIDIGADVNAIGDMGYTPMHCAAVNRHKSVIDVLLNAGASWTIKNEFGETPIDIAKRVGNSEVIIEFISKFSAK